MRRLKDSLRRHRHEDGDPWDEGPLPDLTSGMMWTATGVLGAAVLALPGSDRDHIEIALVMAGFAIGWGLFSLWMASRGRGMTVGYRALVTAATMPVVAFSLWATGGATSFIQPVMIFTALFISYFFPPRLAWPLNVLFIYAYATPLLYDNQALEVAYPARLVMFALATAGATVAIHYLKGRLVRAELHQRTMAERDSLTGVSNRRAFDAALEKAARTREPYALILIDLDDFKQINDGHGHRAGDRVLTAVARVLRERLRESDVVARFGGDEFAVLMPVGGAPEAEELAGLLTAAVNREVSTPEGPLVASAGIALFEEPSTADEILSRADDAMYAEKRTARPATRRLRSVE
jgi:diguanylate cyclase (GGDEF)-like protein